MSIKLLIDIDLIRGQVVRGVTHPEASLVIAGVGLSLVLLLLLLLIIIIRVCLTPQGGTPP